MQHIFNKVYFYPYQVGMIYKKAVLSQGNREMPL